MSVEALVQDNYVPFSEHNITNVRVEIQILTYKKY